MEGEGINNLNFINNLYYSINLTLCLLTFFLNTLIIYIILKKFSIKTVELKLIAILSIFEILLGIEQVILSLFKLTQGYQFYNQNTVSCLIFGFLHSWSIRLEILFVTILALWRYLLVIHKFEKNLIFYLVLLLGLSIPITSLFVYALYIGDLKPSPSYLNCLPLPSASLIATTFSASLTLSLVLPCWLTTYFYFSIGWQAHKKLNEMLKGAINDNDLRLTALIKKEKIKLMLQLSMMFIIYNINFSPSYITHLLKLAIGYKRTPFVEFCSVILVQLAIVFNPLVIISFQPDVNNELKFILVKSQVKIKKLIKSLF